MKSAPLVLKDFWSTFNTIVTVTAVTTMSAGVYKITYDCSKSIIYAFNTGDLAGFKVTHNSTVYYYTITAIGSCDFTITASGNSYTPVITDTFQLPSPTFVHGTQKRAKPEIDKMMQAGNIVYPLVYLQEVQVEKFKDDPLTVVNSEAPIRLWFLLPNDKTWTTAQHYDNDIEAMKNLAHEFIRQLKYDNVVIGGSEPNPYELIYHANCGTESESGHLKDLLSNPHSGVLLVSTLSLSKGACCC